KGIYQSDAVYTASLFSVGIHPWEAEVKSLREIIPALHHQNCRALGEVGLDRLKGPSMEIQRAMLLAQLALANELQKPVIFHLVRAWDEFYALLKSKQTPWIIHGFNSPKQVSRLLQTKVLFSLGPASLQNPHMQSILTQIPLNRVLFETDDTASDINQVYLDYSRATSTPLEEVYAQIEQNFLAIFGA
ncbi:MAG: TatD family hydrolase, partial [Crocinitomicaceae bacterium]|nr:TatD family hydrolase [Crocinitomicaceae bacterium]